MGSLSKQFMTGSLSECLMMGSLSDQLMRAGLVNKEKHEAIEKERREHNKRESGDSIRQASKKSGRPVSFVRLESCGTMAEFKDTARKLLREFPEEITEVIKLAYRFKDAPGGKKLIWLVYQVKDGLAKVESSKREQFLKRAFRKADTEVEIPEDWLK